MVLPGIPYHMTQRGFRGISSEAFDEAFTCAALRKAETLGSRPWLEVMEAIDRKDVTAGQARANAKGYLGVFALVTVMPPSP